MKHSLASTVSCERRVRSPRTTPPATPRRAAAAAVKRCELLYHQALLGAKKGAQLEQEIRQLPPRFSW